MCIKDVGKRRVEDMSTTREVLLSNRYRQMTTLGGRGLAGVY